MEGATIEREQLTLLAAMGNHHFAQANHLAQDIGVESKSP